MPSTAIRTYGIGDRVEDFELPDVDGRVVRLSDVSGPWTLLYFTTTWCPYETAQVRVLLGEAARRADDEETARLEFDAALATFERLGARPDADRVLGLTEGTSGGGPDGLSTRELEVLRLLAGGLSNRDIAEALVISEHTVRRHLSNVYRKIGVTSRSAATAYAFEHALA